jgi:hypothetical protein
MCGGASKEDSTCKEADSGSEGFQGHEFPSREGSKKCPGIRDITGIFISASVSYLKLLLSGGYNGLPSEACFGGAVKFLPRSRFHV